MGEQWTIRGGPMFWLHWLSVYVVLAGGAIVGVCGSVGFLEAGIFLAVAWAFVVIVLGARVAVVVSASGVTIRNGWYTRRLSAGEIVRLTHQNLPMGGGGHSFGNCLAVWLNESEGWPALATIRYADSALASIAQRVIDRFGPVDRDRIEFWSSVTNRGWRPGSFKRR